MSSIVAQWCISTSHSPHRGGHVGQRLPLSKRYLGGSLAWLLSELCPHALRRGSTVALPTPSRQPVQLKPIECTRTVSSMCPSDGLNLATEQRVRVGKDARQRAMSRRPSGICPSSRKPRHTLRMFERALRRSRQLKLASVYNRGTNEARVAVLGRDAGRRAACPKAQSNTDTHGN
jgi:hypothetical protein